MELKKYPNAVLENYSKMLVLLGLVLALFIVYEFISLKSYKSPVKELVGSYSTVEDMEESIVVKTMQEEVEPKRKSAIPEKILIVDDEIEIEESIVESTETDESEAIVIEVEDVTIVEEEEELIEDVPFLIIEDVPVFPGCEGNNEALRACFSEKITEFVIKMFKTDIATELGLPIGSTQKIFVVFRIDKTGMITEVKARAPHKLLQKEAIRVMNLLPRMTPGKQRDKPVSVSYGLPIVFKVQ